MEIHEWKRLDKRVGELVDAPLYIHDSLDLPLNELVETARNSIRERYVHIIFIDCLQMIDFVKEDDNPSDRVAKVMLSLKQLARLTNVPIIVGSMLSRGVEYRDVPLNQFLLSSNFRPLSPNNLEICKKLYIFADEI